MINTASTSRASGQSSARRGKREGGFTLVELMVVVVILAILSSTVIPVMNQSTEARRGASRDEVVRVLEFARGLAIAGGMPVGVSMDTSTSELRVVTVDPAGGVVDVVDQINGEIKMVDLSNQFAGVTITTF